MTENRITFKYTDLVDIVGAKFSNDELINLHATQVNIFNP